MKVQPMSPQGQVQTGQSQSSQDARARAISAFTASQQPEQSPVHNQSQVSPEEMSAIQPSSQRSEEQAPEQHEEQQAPQQEEQKAEDPALSRQFAQLARQERALRARAQQQEQALRAREEAIKAREAQLSNEPKFDQSKYFAKDLLKQDPLLALAEAGVSYDDITNRILNQQPSDPRMEATINALKAEIESLRSGIDETKKTYQDNQTQAYQAAVRQIKADAQHLVSNDPAFETIKATQSTQDVVDLITQTYEKDGILLTVEDAAQQVEDYLIDEALKLAKLSKIQKRLMPQGTSAQASSTSTQQQTPNQTKQPQPMKTLTNATGAPRKLSARERAVLAFKNELKS